MRHQLLVGGRTFVLPLGRAQEGRRHEALGAAGATDEGPVGVVLVEHGDELSAAHAHVALLLRTVGHKNLTVEK